MLVSIADALPACRRLWLPKIASAGADAAIGYTNTEIAAKIDFTPDYIAAICYLLEHGEERLLAAVERGVIPANIAIEIARAPDGDVEQALAEASGEARPTGALNEAVD